MKEMGFGTFANFVGSVLSHSLNETVGKVSYFQKYSKD